MAMSVIPSYDMYSHLSHRRIAMWGVESTTLIIIFNFYAFLLAVCVPEVLIVSQPLSHKNISQQCFFVMLSKHAQQELEPCILSFFTTTLFLLATTTPNQVPLLQQYLQSCKNFLFSMPFLLFIEGFTFNFLHFIAADINHKLENQTQNPCKVKILLQQLSQEIDHCQTESIS